MAITKPPVLPSWAEAGDKVQPSNAEIQTGWPLSSIPPSRQRFNWLLNFLANGIRYFTRRGLPDYDAAETYMTGDRVIGDDGKTYRSLVDNNTAQTPSTSPTKWEEWAPSASRFAELIQKQTYVAFTTAGAAPNFTLTPSPAITAYTTGQRFRVKFHAAGTGADVMNVNALGNKSLKQYDTAGAKVAAVIAANQLADMEYDGVDFVLLDRLPPTTGPTPAQFDNSTKLATTQFLRNAGIQAKGISAIESSTTLTAADVGMIRLCQGAGNFTVTLPLAATLPEGTRIELFCATPNVVVQRQGVEGIHVTYGTSGSVSSLTMGVGDSLTLIAASSMGGWIAVGQPQLYASSRFAAVRGANGYTVQPDGTIRQYGVVTTSGSSDVAVAFPIAFPSGCKSIVATYVNGTSSSAAFASIGSYNSSGFNVGGWNSVSGTRGAITVFWEAVGY